MTVIDGVIRTGKDGPSIGLGNLAHHLRPASSTRGDREPGLSAEGWFTTAHMTYPYGVQIAVIKIDPDTGAVRIEKMLIAFDVGRAINPMLVRGQLVGGYVQGLGGALLEEFQYDNRGQPLSVTFADHLIPTAGDIPEIDVMIVEDAPSGCNPLGIKGAGEGGIAGAGAVIASAVDDALGGEGLITRLPITPQALKAIIDGRQSEG